MRPALLALLLPAVIGTATVPATARTDGDPERGRREFLRCATCHAAEANEHRNGPGLATVYGRAGGTVEGFGRYSEALKQAGIVWTAEALHAWLRDPKTLVPGTSMIMPGIADARVRRDLVAYLQELAARNRTAGGSTR